MLRCTVTLQVVLNLTWFVNYFFFLKLQLLGLKAPAYYSSGMSNCLRLLCYQYTAGINPKPVIRSHCSWLRWFFPAQDVWVIYQGKIVFPDTHTCLTSARITRAEFSCRCLQLTAALVKYLDKSTCFSSHEHALFLWSHLLTLLVQGIMTIKMLNICQG